MDREIVRNTVKVNRNGWVIDGQARILLCASLFYFRIPSMFWKQRLAQVKAAGYHAIDVYFPWNYHEREYENWNFSGERDVEAFLKMAHEAGLFVVARPGPYICSEWDGGGIPAYVLTDDQAQIRQSDPVFLKAVDRWFRRIIPILRKYEWGGPNGHGSVIAVQLENELDFYQCEDPASYIQALRDMALRYGITVPLFACAGQGNLFRATGNVEGVMPTCNFYPHDLDAEFEEKVLYYYERLQERDYPLSVTETNRSHFLLRRLLSAGSKLLGPYLQVSGTNFGFHNAVNNWGKPLAFLTSDYDFYGMIAPSGEERPEVQEGRMLSRLLDAYGERLALAKPVPSPVRVQTELVESAGMRYALQLEGGGYLLSLPNVGDGSGTVMLHDPHHGISFPVHSKWMLGRGECPLLPYQVPLDAWGSEGILVYATAELFYTTQSQATVDEAQAGQHIKNKGGEERESDGSELVLVFAKGNDAELALQLGDNIAQVDAEHAKVEVQEGRYTIYTSAERAEVRIVRKGGKVLRIVVLSRALAKRFSSVDEHGKVIFQSELEAVSAALHLPTEQSWSVREWQTNDEAAVFKKHITGERPLTLEHSGIYRGYGWYEWAPGDDGGNDSQLTKPAEGLLLRGAADILSVYVDDRYEGTYLPSGSSAYVKLSEPLAEDQLLVIRAEIWGHTNFADNLLPALRMSSAKGLQGLMAVHSVRRLQSNWLCYPCEQWTIENGLQRLKNIPTSHDDLAITEWGGWLNTARLETNLFSKKVALSPKAASWVLHIDGLQAKVIAFVNDTLVGEVDLADPYIDITPYVQAGEEAHIQLYLERRYHAPAGSIMLYEGEAMTNFRISGAEEDELWQHAVQAMAGAEIEAGQGQEEQGWRQEQQRLDFPHIIKPGRVAWLTGVCPQTEQDTNLIMQVNGRNAKVTVWLAGRVIGRVWLPCERTRPTMSGGSQENIVLPVPARSATHIALLIEAIEARQDAVIDSIVYTD